MNWQKYKLIINYLLNRLYKIFIFSTDIERLKQQDKLTYIYESMYINIYLHFHPFISHYILHILKYVYYYNMMHDTNQIKRTKKIRKNSRSIMFN